MNSAYRGRMSDHKDKPTWSELQQIEADYDPEKDVITERVYGLLSRAERPRRNVTGRVSG